MEGEDQDPLSLLPNCLLVAIFSLLPVKSAAATSVLSRRWRHLLTQLTDLIVDFNSFRICLPDINKFNDHVKFHNFFDSVHNIVERLANSRTTLIRSVTLQLPLLPLDMPREQYSSEVESWIFKLCTRKPEEIKLSHPNLKYFPTVSVTLPDCVWETKTLVVLQLEDVEFTYKKLPHNISLPNLKKLLLTLHNRNQLALIELLFKSCPLLEDLSLMTYISEEEEVYVTVDISSCPNLKRLALDAEWRNHCCPFVIDAPNLQHLSMNNSASLFSRFVNKPHQLVDANISFREIIYKWDYDYSHMSKLLHGISTVNSLHLIGTALFKALEFEDGTSASNKFPVFHNLTQLRLFDFDYDPSDNVWNRLNVLLRWSPNLELLELCMDYGSTAYGTSWVEPDSDSAPGPSFLSKLKTMKMMNMEGELDELRFMRYILCNANVLEQFHVYVVDPIAPVFVDFCQELLSCPRSSSVCEIKIFKVKSSNYVA